MKTKRYKNESGATYRFSAILSRVRDYSMEKHSDKTDYKAFWQANE